MTKLAKLRPQRGKLSASDLGWIQNCLDPVTEGPMPHYFLVDHFLFIIAFSSAMMIAAHLILSVLQTVSSFAVPRQATGNKLADTLEIDCFEIGIKRVLIR